MQEGDRASWKGANKVHSGTLVGKHPLGWEVRLDGSDKIVIVHRKSIINNHEG